MYGASVAGLLRATLARVRTLELGEVTINDPVTMLSLTDAGAVADRELAGSVGNGILMRFAVTFSPKAAGARPSLAVEIDERPEALEGSTDDRDHQRQAQRARPGE